MRKQHVLFAALAAAVALSASGCKSREKIDLDTLHTSEAETMASTEASGGDKEKETEKETQKETEKETEETQKGAKIVGIIVGDIFKCPLIILFVMIASPAAFRPGHTGKQL